MGRKERYSEKYLSESLIALYNCWLIFGCKVQRYVSIAFIGSGPSKQCSAPG